MRFDRQVLRQRDLILPGGDVGPSGLFTGLAEIERVEAGTTQADTPIRRGESGYARKRKGKERWFVPGGNDQKLGGVAAARDDVGCPPEIAMAPDAIFERVVRVVLESGREQGRCLAGPGAGRHEEKAKVLNMRERAWPGRLREWKAREHRT
jgi:hypothetical protein